MNDILWDAPTFVCKEIPYATCQTIHTYFARHFATYLLHFEWHFCYMFTYMFIHLRGNFMLYMYSHIFTFIWRTISCYTFIEKAIFVLLIHILKGNFMSYVPILRSIFMPYLAYMHICKAFGYLFNIHMYMVNDIFTPSRYKEIIMVQPKPSAGLKGKPHQHALTFMPSCIQKIKGLGP